MAVVTMKQLLDSGVHFGHQTRRWNPKMKRFIFTDRNGIYIIDLQQTLTFIDKAYEFVKETVAHGGTVLFVGTKKQAQESIADEATRVGMPYVNQRWLGGMLTNFSTVHKRLQRLKELEAMEQTGGFEGRTKKEHPDADRGSRTSSSAPSAASVTWRKIPSRGLDRRHQQGAHRRRRGAQAGHPGHRDPRHQLRPRRRRLPDPGQRRRDPLRRPADPGDRRRRRRGPAWRVPVCAAATSKPRGGSRRAAGRLGAGTAEDGCRGLCRGSCCRAPRRGRCRGRSRGDRRRSCLGTAEAPGAEASARQTDIRTYHEKA